MMNTRIKEIVVNENAYIGMNKRKMHSYRAIRLYISKPIWYIAHNDIDTFHFGYCELGEIASGQPLCETFTNEQDWIERLAELGQEVEITT
jgi:hypothetical protein